VPPGSGGPSGLSACGWPRPVPANPTEGSVPLRLAEQVRHRQLGSPGCLWHEVSCPSLATGRTLAILGASSSEPALQLSSSELLEVWAQCGQ
jgi:hypothetical protein